MSHQVVALFVPILVSLGAFMMIWGIRYLENKENMALIERGIDVKKNRRRADPSRTLKNGMVFVGAGIGLLLSIMVTRIMGLNEDESVVIYFALIAIFGGLGMLFAYFYERRNPPKDENL